MPAKILRLDTPEVITLTHVKICQIKVEADHGTTAGSLTIWMSKCYHDGTSWIEPAIPGFSFVLDGATWAQLKGSPISGLETIQDVESVLYQLAGSMGGLPPGVLEDFTQ
jgi:hypothetical protein